MHGNGEGHKVQQPERCGFICNLIPFGIYEREERKRKIIGRQTGSYSGG